MHITVPAASLRSLLVAPAAAVLLLASAAPARAGQYVGMQTHLLWGNVDAAGVNRQLDAARSAGANIVRVDLGWAELEASGKGQWSQWALGRTDNVVAQAQARGIKVLFTLWQTPCWASSAPSELKQSCSGAWWDRGVERYAPTRPSDYADALAFLVRRYGSRVAAWEIWNEPNSDDFLHAADRVSTYANLVKAAYPAAKAADPTAKIIAGSLMWADYSFTEKLFQHGIKGYFDAYSIHPYSEDRSPLDPQDQWINVSFLRGVPAVRDVQLRYGDTKPLWLTEYGWSTSTVRNAEPWVNGVDESVQAQYVGEAITQLPKWPYVEAAILYGLLDMGSDRTDRNSNFGLLRQDFTPKPAFAAFRTAAAAVATAPAPTAAPTPSPSPTPTRKGKKRLARIAVTTILRRGHGVRRLRVRRVGGRLKVSGRAFAQRRVTIRLRRHGALHLSARRAVRSGAHGRFASVIRRRGLRRGGRWHVYARVTARRPHGTHQRPAAERRMWATRESLR